jgi:hypothetical protein
MSAFRLLVCGGRDYDDQYEIFTILDRIHARVGLGCIIHGAARGADTLAGKWAEIRGIPQEPYPADWKQHGRAAGPIRNRAMLIAGNPDGVVAFPGGRGTADMVRIASEAGVKVWTL